MKEFGRRLEIGGSLLLATTILVGLGSLALTVYALPIFGLWWAITHGDAGWAVVFTVVALGLTGAYAMWLGGLLKGGGP